MIDTIFLRISGAVDMSVLTNNRSSQNHKTGLSYDHGMLENLSVTTCTPIGEAYIQGSIRKFYFGDSALDDLNFNQLIDAFDKLRSILKIKPINFNTASVTRLDMGITMRVDQAPMSYIGMIESRSRLRKDKFGDQGVQFPGANKKIIFYNKYLDVDKKRKDKKGKITYRGSEVNSENWLRYEVQWKKLSGLKKQVRPGQDLIEFFDERRYNGLINRLITEFETIKFSGVKLAKIQRPITLTADALATALVYSVGVEKAKSLIEGFYKTDLLSVSQRNAAKKKISLCADNIDSEAPELHDELVQELSDKINYAYIWHQYQDKLPGPPLVKDETIEIPSDMGIQLDLEGNFLPK